MSDSNALTFTGLRRLGAALVISGPSGAGKSSVCKALLSEDPGLAFSVSHTTRAPRPGEVHGKDYFFIDRGVFETEVASGAFLESAEVHGNFYGTARSEVIDRVRAGVDVLLDIDAQGAARIRRAMATDSLLARCVSFVFIAPPSFSTLERRLRDRGTETEAVIARRLENAKKELARWREYDYLIVNDALPEAIADLRAVLRVLRRGVARVLTAEEPS